MDLLPGSCYKFSQLNGLWIHVIRFVFVEYLEYAVTLSRGERWVGGFHGGSCCCCCCCCCDVFSTLHQLFHFTDVCEHVFSERFQLQLLVTLCQDVAGGASRCSPSWNSRCNCNGWVLKSWSIAGLPSKPPFLGSKCLEIGECTLLSLGNFLDTWPYLGIACF